MLDNTAPEDLPAQDWVEWFESLPAENKRTVARAAQKALKEKHLDKEA